MSKLINCTEIVKSFFLNGLTFINFYHLTDSEKCLGNLVVHPNFGSSIYLGMSVQRQNEQGNIIAACRFDSCFQIFDIRRRTTSKKIFFSILNIF